MAYVRRSTYARRRCWSVSRPGPRYAVLVGDPRILGWDVALYMSGAVVAGIVALTDRIPLQRTWGRIAFWPYVAGAILVAILALSRRRRLRGSAGRARAILATAVLIGVALLPMFLEVGWRARDGFTGHVQSETLVTEESARSLLHGHDPYAASFASGPLGTWPAGVADHAPYMPALFAFGMPRALAGVQLWTDARVWFSLVSFAVLLAALWLTHPPWGRGLTALLIVVAFPTGARYLAGGGDDVAVLSVMLLSLVFLHRNQPVAAGLIAGLAAALKQTAWPLLPFLVMAARDREENPARGRAAASAAAVVIPLTLPFVMWNPLAFVEDAIRFPLGLGHQATLAASPTLGSVLAHVLPVPKAALAAGALALVLAVAAYLAFVRPPVDARGAAERTAAVLALAILLATAGRFGYLLYPIGLFAWARLVFDPGDVTRHAEEGAGTGTLRWSASREGARAAKGSGL
jgi:hypothetical protein